MPFRWETTPEQAFVPGFDAYQAQLRQQLREWAQYFADQIELDMKANASWKDVTGDLRRTLYAEVESLLDDTISIVFDYGLERGVYMVVSHAAEYDIIGPTLDKWSVIVWNRVQQLMG